MCLRPCGIWLVLFFVIYLLLADTQYCFTFCSCFFFRLLPVLGNTFRVYSRYDGGGEHKIADPPDTPLQIEVFLEKDSWCFGSDKVFYFSLLRVALGLITFFFAGIWAITGKKVYKQQFTRGGGGGGGNLGIFVW